MKKDLVIAALRLELRAELHALEQAAAMAVDETTSAETKQESKYDTRATEASYLAAGQAQRVAALRQLSAWFDQLPGRACEQIQVGALFQLQGSAGWLLMAPVGGSKVTVEGAVVRVVSPSSPLGQALSGLEAGDAAELQSPQGRRDVEVIEVL